MPLTHILPITDSAPHRAETMCPCNPRLQIEDGEMTIIHNAFTDNKQEWMIVDEDFDFIEDNSHLN